MYMARIDGWDVVLAFSNNPEKAKELAVEKKKSIARDDLDEWTWETVSEYYGADLVEVKDGMVLREGSKKAGSSLSESAISKILDGQPARSVLLREYNEKHLEIEPGDKITVGNDTATVKDILFQDVYLTDSPYSMSTADVEFEDENDNYRHWQSWSDGGTLTTKDGKKYTFQKET
jgi:hypothetical protein